MICSRCEFSGRATIAAALVWLVAGCSPPNDGAVSADSGGEADEDDRILVRTVDLTRGDISRRLAVAADLEAVSRADLTPEIAGVVATVHKREGDRVGALEPVVTLVDTQLRLALDNKRIAYEQAKIATRQAENSKREGEKIARQKELIRLQVEKELERIERGGAAVASEEEIEQKRAELEQKKIDAEAAQIQGEGYALSHEQKRQEEELARVAVETATFQLSQTVLASPIEGVISYLRLKPGELVSTATKAFSVVDLSRLEARLFVPQREVVRVKPGLTVHLRCEVFPELEFAGRVEVINPVVDDVKGTIEVIVGISDDRGVLKPGMYVSGDIVLETRPSVYLIPKKAISYENRQAILFFVRDGVAHRYVMSPGLSQRDAVELVSLTAMDGSVFRAGDDDAPGIAELGALVLVGHDNLEEGSPVEVES